MSRQLTKGFFREVPLSEQGKLRFGKSQSCANGGRRELARSERLCALLKTEFREGPGRAQLSLGVICSAVLVDE